MFSLFQKKLRVKLDHYRAHKKLMAIPLSSDDVVIDCGANVGNVSAKLVSSGATIYAFEPNPYAFAALQQRFTNNDNVHCIQKGVLDEDGTTKLFLHKQADDNQVKWSVGSSMVAEKGNVSETNAVEVETVDLSAFIRSLNTRVKIVKIDVEGSEYRILKKLITDGTIDLADHVLVETHEDRIPELRDAAADVRRLIQEKNLSHIDLEWC